VLSGRGLCDGPIPRPEESYRLWCVSECDQVKNKTPLHLLRTSRQKREGLRKETKRNEKKRDCWTAAKTLGFDSRMSLMRCLCLLAKQRPLADLARSEAINRVGNIR
jgi:hypothetical protein